MTVAVIGAGLMGHGIAQVLATGGEEVVVHDAHPAMLASLRNRIAANLRALDADEAVVGRVRTEAELEAAVSEADWVIEAAPEDLELKQELFARMDRAAPEDAILASNSSVMRITEIAAKAARRERIVGTHWWNPPYLVPLVEVVQGEETSPETVERMMKFLGTLGKTPVHVRRDVAGFVGNRLQHALWREAFNLIDEGVCDAETVDTVVKQSFGRRLAAVGPVENADLIGLDLTLAIHDYVLPRLDPPSQPSSELRRHVAKGELGMRSGRGFREWSPSAADETQRRILNALSKVAQ